MNTAKTMHPQESRRKEVLSEKAAQLLFSFDDCIAESRKEYLERIRRKNLILVMKEIIKGELTEQQWDILRLKHFEGKSYEEIGKALYMSSSAALRGAKKAEGIVSAYMKYVVSFADMVYQTEDKPLDVKMAVSHLLLENATKDKIGARMKKARNDNCVSVEKAALCTGISADRINSIEESGSIFSGELKRLISFYGVSADYIIFGAK